MKYLKNSFISIIIYCLSVSCVFILCSTTVNAVSNSEPETIRVIIPDYTRVIDVNDDGYYVGYGYEYLKEIAKYTQWNYEFITDVSLAKGIEMIKNGEADLIGPIANKTHLERIFDFPEYSIGYQYNILASLDGFTYEDIKKSENFKIGILTGSGGSGEIHSFCENLGIVSYKVALFDNYDEMITELKLGNINCIFTNNFTFSEELDAISVSQEPYLQYFATLKGYSDIIKQVNNAIGAIKIEKPEFQTKLQEKYYTNINIKAFNMSDEEKQYIDNLKDIIVHIDTDSPPFSYYNSNNEICGINIDLLNYIENALNIKVNYIIDDTYTIKDDMLEPSINVLCVDDAVWAQKNNIYVTSTYLTSNVSAITNNSINNYKDKTLRVAYIEGSYIGYNYVKEEGYINKVAYNTFTECIRAVDKGDADITFVATHMADCADRQGYLRNSSVATVSNIPLYYGISISKNTDYILYSILNRLVESVPDSFVQNSVNTHLSYFNNNVDLSTYIYKNPTESIIISVIVLLIIFMLVILIYTIKSERRGHKLELEKYRLEEADRAKNEFFSRMSHEMRTPLNVIMGIASLMEVNKANPQKVMDGVGKIQISAQHLLQIISDILDINKITSKAQSLNLAIFDIYNMIASIYAIYKEYAEQNGITFDLEIDNNIPKWLIGDELRIKQIIINLLSNAIKYNKPDGKILLTVKLLDNTSDDALIYFSVGDTGIGIDPKNINNIFNEFERVEESSGKEGTGLGLAIVKNLIEVMGSQINVESIPNEGSCFQFELKLDIAKNINLEETTDIAADRTYSLENKHYLVIEDNFLNQELTKELLSIEKALVDIASDGKEGVNMFNSSSLGYYDAILMDLNMPVMNGYEASKAIRSLERADALNIAIIGVSANSLESDREKALECGMTNYITKPIDIRYLREMLAIINE